MAEKLSDAQWRILINIRDHSSPAWDFHGMSAMGGFSQASAALFRKGLVEYVEREMVMTEAGQQALAAAEAKTR